MTASVSVKAVVNNCFESRMGLFRSDRSPQDPARKCNAPNIVKWVKLSRGLTKYHTMKTYVWVEVWLRSFLTSALDGGEWPTSRPGHFTHGERASGYPLDRGPGGLQSWSERGDEKYSHLNPGRPARSLVAILTELTRLQILLNSTDQTYLLLLLLSSSSEVVINNYFGGDAPNFDWYSQGVTTRSRLNLECEPLDFLVH
jgi:hypothetical protein